MATREVDVAKPAKPSRKRTRSPRSTADLASAAALVVVDDAGALISEPGSRSEAGREQARPPVSRAARESTELTFGPAARYVARLERAVVRNPVAALAAAFAIGYLRGKLRLRRG
ncbi:MAG: hypothetical protein H0T89_18240 [Deltaproteobacteria bacterium]|nr:hypothetical protein [Deltaproteobacteria bacterium]MDQ3298857.1 hypothetical protein [Myxococcota bacterium]